MIEFVLIRGIRGKLILAADLPNFQDLMGTREARGFAIMRAFHGAEIEMKNRALVPCVIFACVLPAILSALLAEDEIHWLDNYSEAIREAKRTQKPIFLEFRCEP